MTEKVFVHFILCNLEEALPDKAKLYADKQLICQP